LLVAALLAALIGAGAGYAGSRLAQQSSATPTPAVTTAPAPQPSPAVSSSGQSTPAAPAGGQMDTVQVAAAALPSTVMIRVGSGGSGDTGSGFVLDTAGHIMTNNHVIAGAANGDKITVLFSDGARVGAELVGRSPSYDLAVIKITDDHELTPMPVGDSDEVQVGEPVVAIGSPLALASTVTQGIVSAKNRPVVVQSAGGAADSPSAYIDGIQTDAAINPGNSGGPLVDAHARVVGVNSAILTMGQSSDSSGSIGLGFAIPINQAMQIGAELIKNGKATYPVIGVNVAGASDEGVRLSQVDSDGPAAKAGLQSDDVITAIDDHPVSTPEELIVAIRTHRPGDRVTLTYQRGGQQGSATVTLGSREG
jgi:putative serine protease PepD